MSPAGLLALCVAVAVTRVGLAEPQSSARNAYVDRVNDPRTATTTLPAGFKRRSSTAVVFMCYNRTAMIEPALDSVLKSEGLAQVDLFITQDGGHSGPLLKPNVPNGTNFAYIRHTENLNAGVHHYFVKLLTLGLLGYDNLIVLEEDSVIHPQAVLGLPNAPATLARSSQ